MTTGEHARTRWESGDRDDIIAVIDGGDVDTDDTGRPTDDQWELIAAQLDACPAGDEAADEPDTATPMPIENGDLDALRGEITADLDPNRWKSGVSAGEIDLIARLRAETQYSQFRHAEAAGLRGDAAALEERAAGPAAMESDLWDATRRREQAAAADADAEHQLRAAIRAAVPQGRRPLLSVQRVGEITGLTRSRIYQIRDGRR